MVWEDFGRRPDAIPETATICKVSENANSPLTLADGSLSASIIPLSTFSRLKISTFSFGSCKTPDISSFTRRSLRSAARTSWRMAPCGITPPA